MAFPLWICCVRFLYASGLLTPLPPLRGERGSLNERNSRRVPLTRNSLPANFDISPQAGRGHDLISFALSPNIFLRASSSNGSLTNLPIASPACTCGRARTSAYQRLMLG